MSLASSIWRLSCTRSTCGSVMFQEGRTDLSASTMDFGVAFESGKTTQKLVLPLPPPPCYTLYISKLSLVFLPILNHTLIHPHCFNSAISYICRKPHMQEQTSVNNKTSLHNHTCCSRITSATATTPSGRNWCQQQ
jgi:hypothetical protein